MVINIINLPKRTDRRGCVANQMEMEGCSYTFWNGVSGKIPKQNIHKAFKQIIQLAKDTNLEMCCIAEDDLVWTSPGSWKYFLNNIPVDFDVYTASYYSGSHDENFIVTGFRGMTLTITHQRYYETFLSLCETRHIDGAIATSGAKVVVCPKFTAIQANGYSDQRKMVVDDNFRLKNKAMYGK